MESQMKSTSVSPMESPHKSDKVCYLTFFNINLLSPSPLVCHVSIIQTRMLEEFQSELDQKLAEQQRELQNAFAMEKQDLLEQYESRKNLAQIQHQQEIQALEDR